MKKILISGLFVGLAMLVLGRVTMLIFTPFFPELIIEYANPIIYRQYDDPIVFYFFIHPFVMGVLLSFIWQKVKPLIKEEVVVKKGALFGVYYSIFAAVPGMVLSFAIYKISILLAITSIISVFVQDLFAGIIIGYADKRFKLDA